MCPRAIQFVTVLIAIALANVATAEAPTNCGQKETATKISTCYLAEGTRLLDTNNPKAASAAFLKGLKSTPAIQRTRYNRHYAPTNTQIDGKRVEAALAESRNDYQWAAEIYREILKLRLTLAGAL